MIDLDGRGKVKNTDEAANMIKKLIETFYITIKETHNISQEK
jgi:hypothetical protein